LREAAAQIGAQIELREYDATSSEEVAAQFSRADTQTLVVFPLKELGSLLENESLTPIPSDVQGPDALNWSDLLPALRDGLASPGRKPGFVPIACPVLMCYYRQDLLHLAGLPPPATWDDYQNLLDKLGEWAPGLSAVEPWSPEFRTTMFLARTISLAKHPGNYSVFFEMDSGMPLIGSAPFIRGLEQAQRAWERLAPESRTLSPAECRERILKGQAALAIAFEEARPETSDPIVDGRAEEIRIGLCRLPGSRQSYNHARKSWESNPEGGVNRATLVGFAGLGIGASANRDPAEILAGWYALSQLGSRGFVSGLPPAAVSICRESQLTDVITVLNTGLQGGEAGLYIAALAESLRDPQIVIDLPVPRHQAFREALTAALTEVMESHVAPGEALEKAATAWQSLVDDIGAERLKRVYRYGLGLGTLSGP
jgi:hypothetical protein